MMTMNGKEIINRLRNETFNIETESKLENHPYIKTAEQGTLTKEQKLAFCYEQYQIIRSCAISLAVLSGHTNFKPKSLTGIKAPSSIKDEKKTDDDVNVDEVPDLFQFLLEGEIIAAPLLLNFAKSLGLDEVSVEHELSEYQTSPLAQAYPSYWSRIALEGSPTSRIAGAAACAVNFPAWGRMCSRLYAALDKEESPDQKKDHLEFIAFFATPLENMDEMAAAVIDKEFKFYKDDKTVVDYEIIKNHARMLQAYEVYFWDAIYRA